MNGDISLVSDISVQDQDQDDLLSLQPGQQEGCAFVLLSDSGDERS